MRLPPPPSLPPGGALGGHEGSLAHGSGFRLETIGLAGRSSWCRSSAGVGPNGSSRDSVPFLHWWLMSRSEVTTQSVRARSVRVDHRRRRNREALLLAARRLMAERGFAGTTIADITGA